MSSHLCFLQDLYDQESIAHLSTTLKHLSYFMISTTQLAHNGFYYVGMLFSMLVFLFELVILKSHN